VQCLAHEFLIKKKKSYKRDAFKKEEEAKEHHLKNIKGSARVQACGEMPREKRE